MTIHYQNGQLEEKMFTRVLHIQNMNDVQWIATFEDGREITLLTPRIEGIYAENRETI